MSAERKQQSVISGKYSVADVSESVTMDQFREISEIHMRQYREITEMYKGVADHIKALLEGTGLKWWIIAAGAGAIAEMTRIIWLAILWLHGRW